MEARFVVVGTMLGHAEFRIALADQDPTRNIGLNVSSARLPLHSGGEAIV